MVEVAKKYQDELEDIKCNVRESREYFEHNNKRFNEFKKFCFVSSLSEKDLTVLRKLQKPEIELNTMEAYVSRLLGEFSKQEPSLDVMADTDANINPNMVELMDGYIRHMFDELKKDNTEYETYRDLLSGGYSAFKVITDYKNSMSMQQVIKIERPYDVTMCGFDPAARAPHKGDGDFCFEIFPKKKEEIEEEYNIDLTNLKYVKGSDGFGWSYSNGRQDYVLLVDFYKKKKRKKKIAKLADGRVMTMDDYEKMVEGWDEITQPPIIIGKPRSTIIETISRYIYIEDRVLKHEETNYSMLPLIFIDGNSILVRETDGGEFKQYTRPYTYNLVGLQKLRNVSIQTITNDLEMTSQSKIMIPKGGMPKGYEDAYLEPQNANTYIYNQFKDDDPDVRLDRPTPVPRIPLPPEVMASLSLAEQMQQNALGSHDASLGINNNNLSGAAIIAGSSNSNASSMPYSVNYLQGLSRAAEIVVDLAPKFFVTPMTLPIVGKDGKRTFVEINGDPQNSIMLNYPSNAMRVKVTPGLNFAVQKTKALQLVVQMAKSMPIFSEFINTVGLSFILDNLELKGIDHLKMMAEQYTKQMQQQKSQQQQMAMQMNPALLQAKNTSANIQREYKKDEIQAKIQAVNLQLKQQEIDNDKAELMLKAKQAHLDNIVKIDKHDAEKQRAAVDLVMSSVKMDHDRMMDHREMNHKISNDR